MLSTLVIAAAISAIAQPDPFGEEISRPAPLRLNLDETWTQSGALERGDLVDADGSRFDIWPLVLSPGVWNIQVRSGDFDAYMSIFLEENGVTRPDLVIEDDDSGWALGAAGITARVDTEQLIGVTATSFEPATSGAYEVVVYRVADSHPAVPLRALAKINELSFVLENGLMWFFEEGDDLSDEVVTAADEIVKIRQEHQGGKPGGWWELAAARHDAAYIRKLASLSEEQSTELRTAESAVWAGDEASSLENDETAKAHYERALGIRERILGESHPEVARVLDSLAETLGYLGQSEAAIEQRQRAIAIYEGSLGTNHPDTSRAISALAYLYFQSENYEAAHANFSAMLEIDRATLDPRDPALATSLGNLANVKTELGMMAGARSLFEEEVRLNSGFFGPEHPETAGTINALGVHLFFMEEYEAALEQLARAALIREKVLGPDDFETIDSLENLASTEQAMDEFADAAEHFRSVVARRERAQGRSDQDVAAVRRKLGLCLEELEDYTAALEQHERVLEIWEGMLEPGHRLIERSREDIARVKAAMG
jgi:tetratricopeptide (TPR) repeat protein